MQCHYIPAVSLNANYAAGRRRQGRAKTRPMTALTLTYRELRARLKTQSDQSGKPAASSLPNINSALSAFLAQQGFTEDAPVGSDLRASYHRRRAEHRQALEAAGRPSAYIRNRLALLSACRQAVIDADREAAAQQSAATPFQTALRELFAPPSRHTQKGTAKAIGMPLATLKRWLDGGQPRVSTAGYVARLERHFALPGGALVDLLPPSSRAKAGEGGSQAKLAVHRPIAYRERQRQLSRERYALKDVSPGLQQQWQELLAYKTSTSVVRKRRARTGLWRLVEVPEPAKPASRWIAYLGGQRCETAQLTWTLVAQFLGWLALPRVPADDGNSAGSVAEARPLEPLVGMGLAPEQVQTLAHLADVEYVAGFAEWRQRRSGGIAHGGVLRILTFVMSMCHPDTGYLTQSGASVLGTTDPAALEQWAIRCRETYDYCKRRKTETAWQLGKSRDPFEPIECMLQHEDPLVPYRDALARLNADRPATGGIDEAVWFRDRLLMKLVLSNPLRKKNLRELTWFADGTGQLGKTVQGDWVIRIPKARFKNAKGARKRDYEAGVHQDVVSDLEKYLRVYRPMLLGSTADRGYVFLSTKNPAKTWSGLSQRYRELTKRYITGCPGVGVHAARHLVGCTILAKACAAGTVESAWAIVAAVLHDEEETVRQHYARFGAKDVGRITSPYLQSAFDGV